MQLRQRPSDGEAQPGAWMVAHVLVLDLLEGAAEPLDVLVSDAAAGIGDRDPH